VRVEGAIAADAAADPWAALGQAREAMQESGPQLWTFTQTYLPTGFDRGEEESGRLALDLPRCVRWDYDDPYPKSFLLCAETLWTWNPGEPAGRVYDLDRAQPGLDLLLLSVGDLAQRYSATAQPAGGAMRLQLVPKTDALQGGGDNVLRDAAILIGKDGRLRELTYRDAEGNRTTFRFSDRRPLADGSVFTPPTSVAWQREGGGEQP
jgi:outer membrane lipoprotein-sorting protein